LALNVALPLMVRVEPACWKMPWAMTSRLAMVSDGSRAGALSSCTTRVVTVAGTVTLVNRAWKSVLRKITVARLAPAKTTLPGKSLAWDRVMLGPAVTVKVAGAAPLRWVIAPVWVMVPVAAVALKLPRPGSQDPRIRAEPLTTWTG